MLNVVSLLVHGLFDLVVSMSYLFLTLREHTLAVPTSEISGFHGDEHEDDNFQGYCALRSRKSASVIRAIIVLMMEAVRTLERQSTSTRLHGLVSQNTASVCNCG
jgi:hypothetical protein